MIAYPARMTLDISIERDGEGRAVDAAPLEAFVAEALAAEGVEDGAVSLAARRRRAAVAAQPRAP